MSARDPNYRYRQMLFVSLTGLEKEIAEQLCAELGHDEVILVVMQRGEHKHKIPWCPRCRQPQSDLAMAGLEASFYVTIE